MRGDVSGGGMAGARVGNVWVEMVRLPGVGVEGEGRFVIWRYEGGRRWVVRRGWGLNGER